MNSPHPPDRTNLLEVPPGSQARVAAFNSMTTAQVESLQAYGLIPGRWVRVLQHAPVTVIEVENTELALEADLARRVKVET
jgi:Fe2+ transport system protein FeoA